MVPYRVAGRQRAIRGKEISRTAVAALGAAPAGSRRYGGRGGRARPCAAADVFGPRREGRGRYRRRICVGRPLRGDQRAKLPDGAVRPAPRARGESRSPCVDSAPAAVEGLEGRHRHQSELRDRAARHGAGGGSSVRAGSRHRLDHAGGLRGGISRRAVARHSRESGSVHRRRRGKDPDRVAEDHGSSAGRSRGAAPDGRQRADHARAGHQRAHRNHQRPVPARNRRSTS